MWPSERSPERRRGLDPGGSARVHVVNAVAYVDGARWICPQQGHRLLHRFRVRLWVAYFVGAYHHVHQRFQTNQRQTTEGPLPVLAGDQTGLDSSRLDLPHRLHHPRVHAHHSIVVLEVEFPVGGDHGFQHLWRVAPGGELYVQRGADSLKPLGVGSRRKIVLRERMVITVENEPDRIDQGAVEIEEHGLELGHDGEATVPVSFFAGPKSTSPVSFTSRCSGVGSARGSVRISALSSPCRVLASRSIRAASPAVWPRVTKPMSRSSQARAAGSWRRTASRTSTCSWARTTRAAGLGSGTCHRRPVIELRRSRMALARMAR